MDIRKGITGAMKAKGWTIYRLAKESGLTEKTVYRYMNGENDLHSAAVGKLMEVVGLAIQPVRRKRT